MNQFKSETHLLCFKEEEFLHPKFSVDLFVSKCKDRVSIATLREDLENFYKNIQLSLIELINQDYADFVSLSSNLIGTEKSIQHLNVPLGQLKEEIRTVKEELEVVLENIEFKLKQRQQLRDKKSRLHHLMNVVHSVEKIEKILSADPKSPDMEIFMNEDKNHPGNFLERIAGEFNQLQFHVNQSKGHPVIESIRHRVSLITTKLQENLESTFDDGILNKKTDTVLRCLRTYALIDKTSYAENLFRHLVVKPFADEVITESYFTEHGIQKICEDIIQFIEKDCRIVLNLTSDDKTKEVEGGDFVKGFDFLLNSIWSELSDCFQLNLPMLFSAGNPDEFIKHYQVMMQFMEDFENYSVSTESFNKLRRHPSYQSFMIKWSLPVYFQVRFQEIGGHVEIAVDEPFKKYTADKLFMTNIVGVIWHSIVLCWSKDVLVTQLTGRFWKLNLQLGSRLSTFIKSLTQNKDALQSTSIENLTLLLGDGCYFVVKFEEYFKTSIQRQIKACQQTSVSSFQEALSELSENITQSLLELEQHITVTLASDGTSQLEIVQTIPRLHRRTNRDAPSKPSSYIENAFNSLSSFRSNSSTLEDIKQREIISKAIHAMSCSYSGFVNELLMSVKKTEDSLLRLKQQRKAAGGQNDDAAAKLTARLTAKPNELSDENKIRKQIALDVQHYDNQLRDFGYETKSCEVFAQVLSTTQVYLQVANG